MTAAAAAPLEPQPEPLARGLREVGRGALVYGLGQAAGRLLLFVTLPVFTAYLSPEQFGQVALLATLGLFARMAFGLGVGVALGVVYFETEDAARRAAAIWTAAGLMAASGALAVLLAALFAAPLAEAALGERGAGGLIVAQGVLVAAQIAAEPFLLRLQYERRAAAYVLATLAGAVGGVLAAFLLVAWLELGVAGWVAGFVLGAVLTLALAGGRTFGEPAARAGGFRPALLKPLLRQGLPLVPSFGFLFLLQNSGPWFLKELGGIEAAGVYHVGWALGMAMGVATGAFAAAWHPFFNAFAPRQQEGLEAFRRALALYCLAFGGICLAFFVFARPAVLLAAAPDFAGAYRAVGLVALSQFLIGLWSVLLPGMYFARELHFVPLAQGLAAAVALTANLLLIPRLGLEGAALAMALGAAAMVAAQLAINAARRYAASRLDWSKAGALLALLAAAAGCQRAIEAELGVGGATAAGLALLAAFAAAGALLGVRPNLAALGARIR